MVTVAIADIAQERGLNKTENLFCQRRIAAIAKINYLGFIPCCLENRKN
jgi:hypothetical protein